MPFKTTTRPLAMVARVGTAGFIFFLIKGLLWLALPAWFYVTR